MTLREFIEDLECLNSLGYPGETNIAAEKEQIKSIAFEIGITMGDVVLSDDRDRIWYTYLDQKGN